MNVIKRNIPNAITCLNLIGGILAIYAGSHHSEAFWGLTGTVWAWIFIAVAAVADFCDGLAARTLHAYSDLGKELDSLCDNVSFGVAPMLTLYFQLTAAGAPEWLIWPMLTIPVGGVLRLARFNIAEENTAFFIGLPIPANALFWIGYMAAIADGYTLLTNPWVVASVALLESWLMVSPLRIFTFKFKNLLWKGNEPRWITIAAFIILIATLGVQSLMWIVIFYLLISRVRFASEKH